MRRIVSLSRRDFWTSLLCTGMIVSAASLFTPRAAHANPEARKCDCGGTYCQDTGGGGGFRWCCDSSGNCGCTLFTNC